jgi:hypothetical protein
MKAPTFEQVAPWAMRFHKVSMFSAFVSVANNIAMLVTGFHPATVLYWVLVLWALPIGFVNLLLAEIMCRWSQARLRALEREIAKLTEGL